MDRKNLLKEFNTKQADVVGILKDSNFTLRPYYQASSVPEVIEYILPGICISFIKENDSTYRLIGTTIKTIIISLDRSTKDGFVSLRVDQPLTLDNFRKHLWDVETKLGGWAQALEEYGDELDETIAVMARIQDNIGDLITEQRDDVYISDAQYGEALELFESKHMQGCSPDSLKRKAGQYVQSHVQDRFEGFLGAYSLIKDKI